LKSKIIALSLSYTIKLLNMDIKEAEMGVCTTKESVLWRQRFNFNSCFSEPKETACISAYYEGVLK